MDIIPYDIHSLDNELLEKIKQNPLWEDIYESDPILQLFIYIIKYYISLDIATINNTFIDFFPNMSNSSEVIYKFAHFIGLKIKGNSSSSCELTFYLDKDKKASKQVIIPSGTEVKTKNNKVFTTLNTVTINVGENSVIANSIQGQYKTFKYYSNGKSSQIYYIDSKHDDSRLDVIVNGESWGRVDDFLTSTSDDKVYYMGYTKDGFFIQFPNGINGVMPSVSKSIEIKVFETLGNEGRVFSKGEIDTIISSIYDSEDEIVSGIKVKNDVLTNGGNNRDTISQIKRNIPLYFSFNPYLFTKEDYENAMKMQENVYECKAIPGYKYSNDTELFNNVYIYVAKKDGTLLNESDISEFNEHLKSYKSFFVLNIIFKDIYYLPIDVEVKVEFKNKNITQSEINIHRETINKIVDDYFDIEKLIASGKTLFRNLYSTDLSNKIIDEIDEVLRVNILYMSSEIIGEVYVGADVFEKVLVFNNINTDEVYIYIDGVRVGSYIKGIKKIENDFINKADFGFTKKNDGKYLAYLELNEDIINEIMGDSENYPNRKIYFKSFAKNMYDIELDDNSLIPIYLSHSISILG